MSKKKNIAVVAGGYSGERAISIKSGQMIMEFIDRDLYEPYFVVIDHQGWKATVGDQEFPVNRDDFSISTGHGKVTIDGCFVIIHGSPGENGLLQGYLAMIGMPHTTGDVFNMSLTFNKAATNKLIRQMGYNTAKNMLVRKDDHYSSSDIVMNLGMPLFVKPNNGGSSIATTKVTAKEGLHRAIDIALDVDNEVIVEQFVEGTEVTCGVIRINGVITPLPPTEIVSHTDFFDFQAKYEGKSDEITPARIGDGTTQRIQELSARIYDELKCNGMIRVDFIIKEGIPHVVEVNTVPGLSKESILPQQAKVIGINNTQLISYILDDCK